jgi:hypothetical protein
MMSVAASVRVRGSLELLMPAVSRAGQRFWNHPDLATLYPRYLVAVHTVIRASVPLMRQALRVTRSEHLATAIGPALAAYLDTHIPEEMHHDDWLLEDLERIGVSSRVALDHAPSPTVTAMVGTQYYYINHVHPVILLGYISVLEGYPPTEALAKMAADRTGYPLEAFRTLRKHAHLDPHHRLDLDAALDTMPMTDRLLDLVSANALQTTNYLAQLVTEIVEGSLSSRLDHELGAS